MAHPALALLLFGLGCELPASDTGRPTRRPPGDDGPGPQDSADTADSGDDDSGDVPGCGNQQVDAAHEECDGEADDACPGRCASTCQCPAAEPGEVLELVMLDVDQGDAFLLTSPAGFTLLLDAGDEGTLGRLNAQLARLAPGGLDYTLVSHQHADHMGAMDRILADHPEVGLAWDGGGTASSQAFDDYVAAAGERRRTVVAGDTLDLGPGLQVEVLHGDIGATDNENYNSVVLRVTHGEVRTLLGGDCETEGCERFFKPGPIDVYKVHHHGSSDSSAGPMLQAMQPSLALISCGRDNDYGHPHTDTLDALGVVGATVWRTDEVGAVRVRSDGTRAEAEPVDAGVSGRRGATVPRSAGSGPRRGAVGAGSPG